MTSSVKSAEVEISADDQEDLEDLYAELRGVAGVTVEAVPAPTTAGEQGAAFDVLMVALSSGAVTAFLQIIKTLADAKGPKFVLKIRHGKSYLRITADNVDEAEVAIRKLFWGL